MRNGLMLTMLGPFMMATRECAVQMMENASYILNELPNVTMAPALEEQTRAVCAKLIGTKHDLITEIFDLDDLLGTDAPDEKVVERVERIVRSAHEDLLQLHTVVQALVRATELNSADVRVGSAQLLVQESATNVVKAFGQMRRSAETVVRSVRGVETPGGAEE